MTIAERVKKAAEDVAGDFPGTHVLVVAIQDGVISMFAKSSVINEQLDALAALHYIADETAAQASRRVTRGLRKPSAL